MRKALLSLALMFAVCATTSVMAQDDVKKEACPQKTECTKTCNKDTKCCKSTEEKEKCCKSEEKKCAASAEKKCCKENKQAAAGKN